jgi:hypothetical protein
LTIIGTIETQPGLRWVAPNGHLWDGAVVGYDHFAPA